MSNDPLEFKKSALLTVGVELELQLVERRSGDLTRAASDLIALVDTQALSGRHQAGNHRKHARGEH